jgi:hypothetical protein
MSNVKTYHLLAHTESTAQVYVQANATQKVRLSKRPIDHAYGQLTFSNREGSNKTIRLKLNTDEIFLQNQIKPEIGIPANEKYTQAERDALMFRDGVLITANKTVQLFLETSPQFEDFWKPDEQGRVGSCPDIQKPLYKLYDKTVEIKSNHAMFQLRLKAANRVNDLKTVEDAHELLFRLNGSSFKAPDTLEECVDLLVGFIDDADEVMLNALLKDKLNVDEKVTVLLGKAIKHGIISFDKVPDQIVMTVGGATRNVKEISSEYSFEERKRYFSEFLTISDGKLLLDDIQKEVDKKEKKVETK